MAYQALYRRWRPQTFESVVGQTATVKTLRHQIETGQIAHAYLFCGCRGTGKTTMAKLMSRAINCLNPNHGDPCGKCEVCRAIQTESTMDVLELDAASNNSVDNIRELLEQVRYPAQMGKYKVYIIDEVHMLSTAAFNALLKTLEEPPAHVVFILATTEPQKLPATILSRVQRYDFGRIPSELMIGRMKEALDELHMTAEPEALQLVARAAEGAMRDAFSILDMCVAGAENGTITAAQVRDALGTSDREFLFEFMDCIADRDAAGVLRKVDELMRSGREPQVFLKDLSSHCRMLMTVQAVKENAAALLDVTTEDEQRLREQAERFSFSRLLRVLDSFLHAEGELRFASTPRIGLESAALHACETERGEDVSALVERISELEAQLTALQSDIASGKLAVRAESGDTPKKAKAAATVGETDAPKAAKPAPKPIVVSGDAQEVWKQTLTLIAKNNPPLLGLIRNEKFIGEKDGVYRICLPLSKKGISFEKLNQPNWKKQIEDCLQQACGKACHFEAVLEKTDAAQEAVHQTLDNAQQSLIEAFGRETVQIDEEGMKQ